MDPTLGSDSLMSRGFRTGMRLLLLGIVTGLNPGCVFDKWFAPDHGIPPIERQISQQALVEHLNRNIQALHSWSCTDATISARPSKYIPVKLTLSAQVSVEREKNFRLRASSPFGDEADLGSNSERFWFWMRRNKPAYVFTARHEDMGAVGRRLQIPFDPAWIMEALGVVPLDPNSITVQQPGLANNTVLLISETTSPSQALIRRELLVDTHLGVILAHRLFDASGQLLAEARLSEHRLEPSKIIMPHVIELNWPQHQMAMTMTLKTIEINPSHLPSSTWQLPSIPDTPLFDMGRRLNHVETPAPHAPAGERTTNSQTFLEAPPCFREPQALNWQPGGERGIHQTASRVELEAPPF